MFRLQWSQNNIVEFRCLEPESWLGHGDWTLTESITVFFGPSGISKAVTRSSMRRIATSPWKMMMSPARRPAFLSPPQGWQLGILGPIRTIRDYWAPVGLIGLGRLSLSRLLIEGEEGAGFGPGRQAWMWGVCLLLVVEYSFPLGAWKLCKVRPQVL